MEHNISKKGITVGIIGHGDHSKISLSEAISEYLQKGAKVKIVDEESTIKSLLQRANDSIKDINILNEELDVNRNPSVRKRTHHKKR